MTQRGRWAWALAAAVLIAAAAYVSTVRRSDRPAGVGELLYPGLEMALDDVTTIRIKGPGQTAAVTLERAESGWKVAERSGFAADSGRVRTLLLGLAQARTLEEKSSLPENYPSLGVEDLTASGATGTGVELEGPAKPVSLIVGKSTDGRSTYVRRAGEAASWQVGTALTVERDPAKWLATQLLDIGADRVQSAEFAVPGKRPWTAAKASRADLGFTVTGKPPGGAPDSTGNADRVPTALKGLQLSDVRPAADAAVAKPAATATYRTFDGLVLAIDGFIEDDKRFIRVRPSVDEAAARRFFAPPAATAAKGSPAKPADTAAEPAKQQPPAGAVADKPAAAAAEKSADERTPDSLLADTRAEAAKLEAQVTGWTFEIPSWSYDTLFPKIGSEPK
jgi:hypothetical protein